MQVPFLVLDAARAAPVGKDPAVFDIQLTLCLNPKNILIRLRVSESSRSVAG